MATSYSPLKINGVLSTNKTVLQNLNDICTACGTFLTFDISQGKWAVVINKTDTSVKSYNNSNIIGNLSVTESGVSELYNSVSMEFPHKNLKDQTDFIELVIPVIDRFPNELDNPLQIQTTLINDPVQAQYIAGVELNQSRLNKIITFTTDYTSLGLKAGDLIDVTNTMYGYTSKLFRVIKIEEVDEEVIGINITAREYDADIYNISSLIYKEKTKKTGILLKQQNETIRDLEDAGVAGSLGRMLAANVGLGIVNSLLNKLFGRQQIGTDANGNPIYSKQTKPVDDAAKNLDKVLGGAKAPTLTTISAGGTLCEGASKTITVGHTCSVCLFDIPPLDYPYTITGISAGDISIPLTGNVTVTNGTGALTFTATNDATAEGSGSEVATITIGSLSTTVTIWDLVDYALVSATRNNASITEGGSSIVTLTATGSKADASIPYVISGTASGKVASPALTGTVTTSGGTATLTITTTDDGIYQGTQGLTVTFGTSVANPCAAAVVSTSITVLDNESAPPTPPADINCVYVSVPSIWCGVFDGTDFELKSMTVKDSVNLPVPQAGEATITVPTSVSVSKGNPSTITVTASATVAASALNVGGHPVRIITSFDSVAPKGLITGTTITLYGY
jgi:hypothetical protein